MRKGIVSFLMVCLLCGCTSPVPLKKQMFTIELGQDVYANPALYVKGGDEKDTSRMEIVPVSSGIRKKENRFVSGDTDFLVVGEYDFKLVDGSKETQFRIKIKDTKPPTFNNKLTEITVEAGEMVNWQDQFKASDLSGVSYDISPNVDTNIKQDTEVKVKISDRYGNAVVRKIVVHVA